MDRLVIKVPISKRFPFIPVSNAVVGNLVLLEIFLDLTFHLFVMLFAFVPIVSIHSASIDHNLNATAFDFLQGFLGAFKRTPHFWKLCLASDGFVKIHRQRLLLGRITKHGGSGNVVPIQRSLFLGMKLQVF